MKYIFANYEENPMIRFIISELDKHTFLSVRTLKISIEERFRISPLAKKRNISNIIRNVSRDLISLGVLEKWSKHTYHNKFKGELFEKLLLKR